MKTTWQFLCRCVEETDRSRRFCIVACAALLLSMMLFVLLSGCASTSAGLDREQTLYRAGTNVVATLREVVPYLPAPAGTAAEGLLALATVALTAWNTHQHLQIKRLKNGNGNGHAAAEPPPGPSPPART